jgi:hypothetical protein
MVKCIWRPSLFPETKLFLKKEGWAMLWGRLALMRATIRMRPVDFGEGAGEKIENLGKEAAS